MIKRSGPSERFGNTFEIIFIEKDSENVNES